VPQGGKGVYERVVSGAVDMTQWYLAPFIVAADKQAPIVFLAGVHVGCQELVVTSRLRTIRDLKGKTVAAPIGGLNSVAFAMLYALRLHEVGITESTPRRILAEHTDWRFVKEIRNELKS
jgi:ABC-type nitrate/sulfonate/bicarbonate transport system substrate-binding protein